MFSVAEKKIPQVETTAVSEYFDTGFLEWLQPTGVGGASTSHQVGANKADSAVASIVARFSFFHKLESGETCQKIRQHFVKPHQLMLSSQRFSLRIID